MYAVLIWTSELCSWGDQTAGSAYLYSSQKLLFGFARQNQNLFYQLYFI